MKENFRVTKCFADAENSSGEIPPEAVKLNLL
jgi:hypothetical protein